MIEVIYVSAHLVEYKRDSAAHLRPARIEHCFDEDATRSVLEALVNATRLINRGTHSTCTLFDAALSVDSLKLTTIKRL